MRFFEAKMADKGIKSEVKGILERYLETSKHRKTPERFAILEIVYSLKGHFFFVTLGIELEKRNFRVSRGTLYNTLNLLMELRLVIRHRFQGATVYEACYHNKSHCHQVCTVCGKVSEIISMPIIKAVNETHLKRFRKDGFTLYIFGVCSTCQARITRQQRMQRKRKQ